jgi:hypothetical protein
MSKRLSVAATTTELQKETNPRNDGETSYWGGGFMEMGYGTWKHPLDSIERTQNVTE